MSEVYQAGGSGSEEEEVIVVRGGGGLPFYHVPQQSRREKLRYPNAAEEPPPPLHHHLPPPPPPPFLHYNNFPLSAAEAAATTTTTAAFMSSSSSSFLLNPSGGYGAGPYDNATPFLLRDHLIDHPLFGSHHHQGVSLSLSSSASPQHPPHHHHHGHPFDPTALGGPLPLAAARGPAPVGPFTGYATILKGSRFLRPAQQLLEDVGAAASRGALACAGVDEPEAMDLTAEEIAGGVIADGPIGGDGGGEHRRVKTRLIYMLNEVYRRYKQYYQQIQAVITSFESVAGLSTAAPYTSLALKSMSKHFRCLKNAISDQLRFANSTLGKEGHIKDEIPGFRLVNGGLCHQRTQSSNATNQHIWRPQRGLPEHAVAVLRAWLFEHFLHPYPTDMDKQMLAKQTGLSRNQVSNWFINARVRLWKPMVEEIHSLEVRQAHKVPAEANSTGHRSSNKQPQIPTTSSVFSPTDHPEQPTQNIINTQRNLDPSPKRFRNGFTQIPNHTEEPLNFSFDDLSSHHQVEVGMGVASGGSTTTTGGGVSLTLGLHQNNGICLSEQLPLNVVRRFGLEESNVAYVMGGGFEGQDRHFGKDIDGQLLRDFVG